MLLAILLSAAQADGSTPFADLTEPCQLPAAWGSLAPADSNRRRSNHVGVASGLLVWNNTIIDERILSVNLRAAAKLTPKPLTILRASPDDCGELRRIARQIAKDIGCTPQDCVIVFDSPMPPPIMSLAPPAPSAPPPPGTGRKVTPSNSPQGWITNDDYPLPALRAAQSGITGFRLHVDTRGVPIHCTIVSSSGSRLLDEATCRLLLTRALFLPALDANNRAIPATWTSRMRWELPDDYTPAPIVAPLSWTSDFRFTIGEDLKVSGCKEQDFGQPGAIQESECPEVTEMPPDVAVALRGASKGDVTILYRREHRVSGVAVPPAPPVLAGFKRVVTTGVTFDIDETGYLSNCRYDASLGVEGPADCGYEGPYAPGPKGFSVTITETMYTTGDPDIMQALRALEP